MKQANRLSFDPEGPVAGIGRLEVGIWIDNGFFSSLFHYDGKDALSMRQATHQSLHGQINNNVLNQSVLQLTSSRVRIGKLLCQCNALTLLSASDLHVLNFDVD